jgi:O-acetyl-ADP-ribose deacetylase (regulator of RNase III)
MIKYVKGDLIQAFKNGDVDVIAHQANCFHTFGSGIARQISYELPEAYYADLDTEYGSYNKLGTVSRVMINNGFVFNLYGQHGFGKDGCNTIYAALNGCLINLEKDVKFIEMIKEGSVQVAMPKIGCGLGGGDWGVVSTMIEEVFSDREVLIYEL